MNKQATTPVLGIGNDILEIERIRMSVLQHEKRLLNRIFTENEQKYCFQYRDPIPHIAGRFAAKEAVAKALGTGIGEQISWKDMEIFSDEKGRPHVKFSSKIETQFNHPKILISISHCQKYVTAVAIWLNH